MTRFIKLLAIVALLSSSLFGLAGTPAALADDYANPQTAAQARDCAGSWDKHNLSDGSELTAALGRKCFSKGGNCTAKATTNAKVYKVHCTDDPGTNVEVQSIKEAQSQEAQQKQDAGNTAATDPAIDFATSGCNKDACNIINNYINPFIQLLTVLVGLAVVVGIIIGAIQTITSAGDPQKAASGRNHIRNALIAMVAYLLLFGFLSFLIPGGIL